MLTKREENRLLVFERKVFLTILLAQIVGVYRSRYNFELNRKFNSPNVIGVVKNNSLRYAGHMIKGPKRCRKPCSGPMTGQVSIEIE
jgi:hypothetical protein